MPPELDPIVQALQARAWYPFAAAALTVLVALWRRFQPLVWEKIPQRWQWVPVVFVAASGGFVHAEIAGSSLTVALTSAVYALFSGAMTSIGIAHTYKRVAGMKDVAKSAPVAIVLFLLLGGCASFKSTVRDVSDVARDMCEVVLAGRPEVVAQAKQQGLSPLEVAKALCAINTVVNPFLQGARDAGEDAVGEAHRAGLLRDPDR
jgi:hypothetical protein